MTIGDKKCCLLCLLLSIVLSVNITFAQLAVTINSNANQLVQDLAGNGVTISAVTKTCPNTASGTFNGAASNIGINSGIYLGTGNALNAVGPNSSATRTTRYSAPGDALLDAISGFTTEDACVLQFDFVPESDTIKFNYVFASEEYPEYVCSDFNDVFGFFITGTNPAGGTYAQENIALVPGSTTEIAINSVNRGTVGAFAFAPFPPSCNLASSAFYVDNTGGTTVEFDGFTTKIQAIVAVVPCQTYSLKLAIADAGDDQNDSGVFLESNSLQSNNNLSTSITYPNSNGNNVAIEDCRPAVIEFTRSPVTSNPIKIKYLIQGSATNGIDYTTIPSNITIPAGVASNTLIIDPITDLISEGNETVRLIISDTTCIGTSFDTIDIDINDELVVNVSNDTTICAYDNVSLRASIDKTVPFYWSPGGTLNDSAILNPVGSPDSNIIYSFITNNLGCFDTQLVAVTVIQLPAFTFADTIKICNGETFDLTSLLAFPAGTLSWYDNVPSVGNVVTNVSPATATTYWVMATNLNCIDSAKLVIAPNPIPTFTNNPNPTICFGESYDLSLLNGPEPGVFEYFLGNPSGNNSVSVVAPLDTTVYWVLYTENGCSDSAMVSINVNPIPIFSTLMLPTICEGDSINLCDYNGPQSGDFVWYDNVPGAGAIVKKVAPSVSTNYWVTYTELGCTDSLMVLLTVVPFPSVTVAPDPAICLGDTFVLSSLNGGQSGTYVWFDDVPSVGSLVDTVFPTANTTYWVLYTENGCSDSASILMNVDATLPILDAISGPIQVCKNDTGIIYQTTTPIGAVSYNWSVTGGTIVSGASTLNIKINWGAIDTGLVCISASNGCGNASDTCLLVVIKSRPTAILSGGGRYCSANPTAQGLQINFTGIPPFSFEYAINGVVQPNVNGVLATPYNFNSLDTGTYTLISSSDRNCLGAVSGAAIITEIATPMPPVVANAIYCAENILQPLTPIAVNPDSIKYYLDANLTNLDSMGASYLPNNAIGTVLNLYITETVNGCESAPVLTQIFNRELPNVNAGADTTICQGSAIGLGGNFISLSSYKYKWTANPPSDTLKLSSTTIKNPTLTAPLGYLNTTTYYLTVTDDTCAITDSVSVIFQGISYRFDFADTICIEDSFKIIAIGDADNDIVWDFGDGDLNSQNNLPLGPLHINWTTGGNKQIRFSAEDANGCTYDTTLNILVIETYVNTVKDQTIEYGDKVILVTDIGPYRRSTYNILWTGGTNLSCYDCAGPVAAPKKSTTYVVTVVDTVNGCIASDTVTIEVFVDKDYFIPNLFSPNGDGSNDVFKIYAKGVGSLELSVYSRWGEKVFETTEINGAWDGTFKGSELNPSVFIYHARITYLDEEVQETNGNVTLIR